MATMRITERRANQFLMLYAILEWLRQQPMRIAGAFCGLKTVEIDWEQGAENFVWKGYLDNNEMYQLEFEAYASAKRFRFHLDTLTEDRSKFAVSIVGDINVNFQKVILPSGNIWLRFVP